MTNSADQEDALDELIRDDYEGDPIGHETKWGEGWTREDFRWHFIDAGFEGLEND